MTFTAFEIVADEDLHTLSGRARYYEASGYSLHVNPRTNRNVVRYDDVNRYAVESIDGPRMFRDPQEPKEAGRDIRPTKYEAREFGKNTAGATIWSIWDTWDEAWCWMRIGDAQVGSTLDEPVAQAEAGRLNEPYEA